LETYFVAAPPPRMVEQMVAPSGMMSTLSDRKIEKLRALGYLE
jgi:hypothetical protein